jgi:hypothetical protein
MPGGRPPLGPSNVDLVDGPDDAKARLKAILEAIAGQIDPALRDVDRPLFVLRGKF